MQSVFTLATTTFLANVAASDQQVNLTSTSGVVPGLFLFANRELMRVQYLTGIGNYAAVLRGVDGTATRTHDTSETVYLAQGYQLFASDPQGVPPASTFVNPHINVVSGDVWVVQGDDVPDSGVAQTSRTWQKVTTTQTIGPLGVRVNTVTTPS